MSWAFVVAALVFFGVLHFMSLSQWREAWTTIEALRSEQIRLRKSQDELGSEQDVMMGCYRSVSDRLYVVEEKIKELDWTGGFDETEAD